MLLCFSCLICKSLFFGLSSLCSLKCESLFLSAPLCLPCNPLLLLGLCNGRSFLSKALIFGTLLCFSCLICKSLIFGLSSLCSLKGESLFLSAPLCLPCNPLLLLGLCNGRSFLSKALIFGTLLCFS